MGLMELTTRPRLAGAIRPSRGSIPQTKERARRVEIIDENGKKNGQRAERSELAARGRRRLGKFPRAPSRKAIIGSEVNDWRKPEPARAGEKTPSSKLACASAGAAHA